jgi:hypothetical protein
VTGLSPLEKHPESWELPQNASIDLSFRMVPFLLNLEHSHFLRFYGQGFFREKKISKKMSCQVFKK